MTQGAVWRTPRKLRSENQIGSSTFARTQLWWNALNEKTEDQVSVDDDDLGSGWNPKKYPPLALFPSIPLLCDLKIRQT